MALAFKRSFVYHGLFPNFKVSALTIITGLKRLGSVAEVLIQLPINIPACARPKYSYDWQRRIICGYKNDSNAPKLEG